MWPASGARLPVIRLNSLVLPAPLPPIRLVMVPAFTSNDRSLTARRPPKDFDSASSLRSAPSIVIDHFLFQHITIFADQTLAAEAREEDQQQPVEDLAQLRRDRIRYREELEGLRQEDQQRHREHRAVQASGTADDHQRDDNRREDEDRELDTEDALAERRDRDLVLADRAQQTPERCAGDAQRDQV